MASCTATNADDAGCGTPGHTAKSETVDAHMPPVTNPTASTAPAYYPQAGVAAPQKECDDLAESLAQIEKSQDQ